MAYDPYAQPGSDPKYAVGQAQALAPAYGAPVPVAQMGEPQPQYGGEGYSFLGDTKKLLIKQRFELLETMAGVVGFDALEFSNKYDIIDEKTGEKVLYAAEESSCWCRLCCKPNHAAKLHIFDVRSGTPVPLLRMEKPFKLNCCICLEICQKTQKTFNAVDDTQIGSAKQAFPCGGWFTPKIIIQDMKDQNDMIMRGPTCCVGGGIELCWNLDFKIRDKNNTKIGKFKHQRAKGFMEGIQQAAGDADNYVLDLEERLPAEKVANLIGTLLLLDYVFFEAGGGCDLLTCSFNCCNLYCCGCLYPCTLQLGGGGGEGGDDGGGFDE